MIETIQYRGKKYPKFQSEGWASQFAFPFAMRVLEGKGYDIGCGELHWKYPFSIPIDPSLNYNSSEVLDALVDCKLNDYEITQLMRHHEAMDLPMYEIDYIFSSHCLEHLPDWVGALEYWKSILRKGGILFLYLPHPDQEYWLPWNNRKHIHSLSPALVDNYFETVGGWTNVFTSGCDLNSSFAVMAEKI